MSPSEVLSIIRGSESPHYLYVLSRPDGRPFYVGVGTGRRVLDHEIQARRFEVRGRKVSIIRKIWREGGEVSYAIHAWFNDRTTAALAEANLIKSLGRLDLRTGELANGTDGGEGSPNLSPDALKRMSDRLRATWALRDRKAATAHLNDPDVKARASATRVGQKRGPYTPRDMAWVTPELRAARSAFLKADPVSKRPGVAAKISASKRGKPINSWMRTEAAKARFSRGAHPRARPIEIAGRSFACKQDAVEGLGVCLSTIDSWLKRGHRGAKYLKR